MRGSALVGLILVLVGLVVLFLLRDLLFTLIVIAIGILGIVIGFTLVVIGLGVLFGGWWMGRVPFGPRQSSWRRVFLVGETDPTFEGRKNTGDGRGLARFR